MYYRSVIGGLYKSPIHDQLEKGIRVLDVGCGPGWWTLVNNTQKNATL